MKLNDPFGRMEKRDQTNYEMMYEAMVRSGIDTVQGAQEIIKKSKERSLKFLSVILVILLLIACFAPQSIPVVGILAAMVIAWTIKSTLNGVRYVNRYIKEEIEEKSHNKDMT